MSNQKSYPGDMTDAQAELLLSLVPPAKPGSRPRTADIRIVINAIFYVLCTGFEHGFLMITPQKGRSMIISKNEQKMERG
jgi:putative transposase